MENYSKGKLLGKGSFGSAWLCTSKLDAKNYVIKEVDISRMPRAERESAEQEAKVRNCAVKPGRISSSTTDTYCPAWHAGRWSKLPASASKSSTYVVIKQPVNNELVPIDLACITHCPAAAAGAEAPQHRALQGMLHFRLQAVHRHGLVQRG